MGEISELEAKLKKIRDKLKPKRVKKRKRLASKSKKKQKEDGPGTRLYRKYKERGLAGCMSCKSLRRQMDKWGFEECQRRKEEIVENILPRALHQIRRYPLKTVLWWVNDQSIWDKAQVAIAGLQGLRAAVREQLMIDVEEVTRRTGQSENTPSIIS